MASFNQLGEMPEKQCQQQHLNVRAVNVRIAQNAHLAIAQTSEVRLIVGAMRVYTNGHRDVVNFGIGKQTVALDFPGVKHFAAQWQDRLAFLVAAHFGAAAGGITFNQKHFVVSQIPAFAIGQFAGQHGHARTLALFNFLAGFLPGLRRADRQLGQFFAVIHVLVQPQLKRRANVAGHQPHRVARVQSLLDLPLKLRVQNLGAQHVAGACKYVFWQQLDTLGQQAVQLNETFYGCKQAITQATFMRAASAGWNQIDITLAHRLAVVSKRHAPVSAFALCKGFMLRISKALAFKHRNHQLTVERLRQVIVQAALVQPCLHVFGFLGNQRHTNAGHQHGLAAQQMRELTQGQHS